MGPKIFTETIKKKTMLQDQLKTQQGLSLTSNPLDQTQDFCRQILQCSSPNPLEPATHWESGQATAYLAIRKTSRHIYSTPSR